jgi:predicted Zn-dependent protease
MATSAVNGIRPSLPRWIRWSALAAIASVLALGAFFGWRWNEDRTERFEALRLAGSYNFDTAQLLLRRLHERHPQDVEIIRALAVGYLDARQLAEAQTFLDRWCALQPQEAQPYRRRLDLWMKQQKVTAAIADAEHILQLEPDDFEVRQLLAQLLLMDGRYEQAEKEGLLCLRKQPNSVKLWYLLASAYRGQHSTAQAVDFADRVVRAAPGFAAGLKLRAELYLDAEQLEPALRLLQQAAATPGADGLPALHLLGMVLARAGREEEARKAQTEMHWRRALVIWSEDEHRDDNAALQERVVEALLGAGKTDEAVRFLTDIMQRNPRSSGTYLLLATCYDKQGQPERAAECRRKAGSTP